MNLLDIKNHMKKVKSASLASLCALFNSTPDNIRVLLSPWIRKGNIRQCTRKPACGSKCFKCPTNTIEMYEWVEKPALSI